MTKSYWLQDDHYPLNVCFGSGRFLRSVLVPALQDDPPVIVQTRGRSFLDHCENGSYEVDTVNYDGSIQTESYEVAGAFSLGADPESVWTVLAPVCQSLRILGVGVTEEGLSKAETTAMKDLFRFLSELTKIHNRSQKLCIINTDNVPNNGSVIQSHMEHLAAEDAATKEFIENHVVFLNSMVDRITSHRPENTLVPRAEPIPAKALVVLDEDASLPKYFRGDGVVRRETNLQLQTDIQLKLRVANGTHTAVAHVMALCGITQTDELDDLLLEYLDAFVKDQVIAAVEQAEEATAVWEDWKKRLTHPHFGLSTFFITQNGAAKGGIRFGPTVLDLIKKNIPIAMSTAFAYAALLRWLSGEKKADVYRGHLCHTDPKRFETISYAAGLHYNLAEGWYEFRCACKTQGGTITECLQGPPRQPSAYKECIRMYLTAQDGGNLEEASKSESFERLVDAVAVLYARMLAGDDPISILTELRDSGFDKEIAGEHRLPADGGPLLYYSGGLRLIPDESCIMKVPVTSECVRDVVAYEVASTAVVDLHTHLLPPSHGPLCLWGIDELLTYHYLVAEYFMTAPGSMTPDLFYAKTKQEQAELVWEALFLDRSPLSEAARGVVTTLKALGLEQEVRARDLNAIRQYYRRWRDADNGADGFSAMVHELSGVRYNVMTNIPFDPNEAQHWHQKKVLPEHYRSALRVDPFLSGDNAAVEAALRAAGYDTSLEGAKQFLRDWIDIIRPEYAMASTPHDFGTRRTSVNLESMRVPGAFALAAANFDGCIEEKEDTPTEINESCDLFGEGLVKVCEERGLPIALKIGAHRQINPKLRQAGDGLVAFADAGMLGRLCSKFPQIRFLATFLSRYNQQEACVLASKFNNLHIYGCWWYCFTPSMVREITQMRIEMLGTAFTAQHSDARVLDQLIYKWAHSRSVVAAVFAEEVAKLIQSGWEPSRSELRRDIKMLLGDSYESFLGSARSS